MISFRFRLQHHTLNEPVEALAFVHDGVTQSADRHERPPVTFKRILLHVVHLSSDADGLQGILRCTADRAAIVEPLPDRVDRLAVWQGRPPLPLTLLLLQV
jgi:hypothetical protein